MLVVCGGLLQTCTWLIMSDLCLKGAICQAVLDVTGEEFSTHSRCMCEGVESCLVKLVQQLLTQQAPT